ncbi:hypothetical protein CR513_32737, partial [Mucuna pruriens]
MSRPKEAETKRELKSSPPKRQVPRPIYMNICKPRTSQPKKTRSKQEPSLSRPIKARTAFQPDPSLVQKKELKSILSQQKGVGHNSQSPRSCRHTWCRIQLGQPDPKVSIDNSSSSPPPMELKPLPGHLNYAYLDFEQQLPIIIASNLHQEHEDKLLSILRQHKKAIGWKLSDLLEINPSIYMHRILMEEESDKLVFSHLTGIK